MPSHLIEFKAFDMLELIDHRDQRLADNASRKPGRKKTGGKDEKSKANEQMSYRRFDRPEKFCLWNDGRKRPTGKGERRQSDCVGGSAGNEPNPACNFLIAV